MTSINVFHRFSFYSWGHWGRLPLLWVLYSTKSAKRFGFFRSLPKLEVWTSSSLLCGWGVALHGLLGLSFLGLGTGIGSLVVSAGIIGASGVSCGFHSWLLGSSDLSAQSQVATVPAINFVVLHQVRMRASFSTILPADQVLLALGWCEPVVQ